jgi:hypothetical protein
MKFKYLVVVVSVVSLAILYLLSGLSQPAVVHFSELPAYEGKQVVVHGIIAGYQATSAGSTLVTIRNDDSANATTITLYVQGQPTLEYGDVVQATGVVQQYNNQWELAVANPESLLVLEHWSNRSLPLCQLAKNPGRYVDTNVNVTGIVGTITPTTFQLQDCTEDTLISVTCKRSSSTSFSTGDFVAVRARFLYNEATFDYLLKVTDPTSDIQVLPQG